MRIFSYTKRLYLILILCLVLIGMCFRSVEADSSFLYTENNTYACQLLEQDATLDDKLVACVSEIHEEALETLKNSSNTAIRQRVLANFCDILLFYFQQFIMQSWTDIGKYLSLCVLFSHILLLSYIHHKDGKKSYILLANI